MDMPLSAQALYFHLGMHTDDEGFVGNPKKIMRMVGNNQDDIKVLITKGFVIAFDSGVIVITHWGIHNTIRKDRQKPTIYQTEKSQISVNETSDTYYLTTNCQPDVNQVTTKRQPSACHVVAQLTNQLINQSSSRASSTTYTSELNEIIECLNQKAGTHYRASTASTQKHIAARLREGYVVADFKVVIDSKVTEWLGTEHAKYLRPETLFGSKFEGYLNAATASPSQQRYTVPQDEPPLLPDDYDEVIGHV